MNRTLSFVNLDFRLIKPYIGSILMLLVMGIAMGFGFKSVNTLSSYFMMSLMLIMSYPFSIGEKNGLDTLYSTLSLKRRTVVIGRYLFVLIIEAIGAIVALLCSLLLSIVIKTEFVFTEILFTLCLLSAVFSLIVALQYPIYFKFGYMKAKLLALVPLFVVFLIIIQLPALAKLLDWDFSSWDVVLTKIMESSFSFLMYVALIVLGLIFLALSCTISCRIYEKRDI